MADVNEERNVAIESSAFWTSPDECDKLAVKTEKINHGQLIQWVFHIILYVNIIVIVLVMLN